jgi:hypothetical protein
MSEWTWVALEEVDPAVRSLLTGDVPIPMGRFLPYATNPLAHPRLFTGFVALCALAFGVFLVAGPLVSGGRPAWAGGGVAVALGLAAAALTAVLAGPAAPAGDGLYLLPDALVAYGGGEVLVIPRAELKQSLASTGSLRLVRHDGTWLMVDAAYAMSYRRSPTHFNLAFKRWVATGEAVFGAP